METMNFTCWFSESRAANPDLVGEMGAYLNSLWMSGLPVHPGFCITIDAYNYVQKVTGLDMPIDRMVAEIDFEDPQEIAAKSLSIRELIHQQPIPREIASEVLENYVRLSRLMNFRHLEGMPVSVSPSFTIAGSPKVFLTDPAQTYLNLRGGCSVLKHIRCCWASLWRTESLFNLHSLNIDHRRVKIAVIVQAMEFPMLTPEDLKAHKHA
jgi:pyruvate,water dikinase